MKKMITLTALFSLTACVTQAALWNSAWAGATYTSISDASNDGGGNELEITSLESIHGTDGANTGYFFRMTLANSGTMDKAYMLNFNTDASLVTGANAGTSTYMATGMTGIDKIVDTHFSGGFITGSHYHVYDGGLGDSILFSATSLASQGGASSQTATQLEWFVPTALLAAGTTVRGSIVDIGTTFGGANPTITWDITDAVNAVPEPTSMALLALGVAVLGLRRKFRS